MTVIRFKFFKPSASGEDVPSTGVLQLTPTRRRVKTGDPGTVILPAPYPAKVPETGLLALDLAPNGPDWCWELRASFTGAAFWTEYLAVPEPVPDPANPGGYLPVDYPDLVRVDPKTLEPVAEPDPSWYAYTDGLALSSEQARDAARDARDFAAGSASSAEASEAAVLEAKAAAESAEQGAATSAAEAAASAASAQAAADMSAAESVAAKVAAAQSAASSQSAQLFVEHLAVTANRDDPEVVTIHFPSWRYTPGDPDSIQLTIGVQP